MTLRTIVLIEDDAILRQDTTEVLQAGGLDVVGFEDGDQALDFIRRHRDDIAGVLTDIGLPTRTDGLEVARLVSEAFPTITIVVTSGLSAERPADLGERIRYLAKPWLVLDLMNALIDATQDE